MTSRERIINALLGKKCDRIPYSPFLAYWWESQDDKLTKKGQLEFLESIGADPLFRGYYPLYGKNSENILLFDRHIEDCEIRTKCVAKRNRLHIIHQKVFVFGYRFVNDGNTWFLVVIL